MGDSAGVVKAALMDVVPPVFATLVGLWLRRALPKHGFGGGSASDVTAILTGAVLYIVLRVAAGARSKFKGRSLTLYVMANAKRIASILATLAAVALLLVAPAQGASRPLSKAVYEQKVQAIGRRFRSEETALPQSAHTLHAQAFLAGGLALVYKHALGAWENLSPPTEVAHDQAVIFKGYRYIISALVAWHTAAARGDAGAAQVAFRHAFSSPAANAAQRATRDMQTNGYHLGAWLGG
jgi:hypothetical protein